VHGYAMSRYAGVWVGLKCVTEVIEASATVDIDPQRIVARLPQDFVMPAGGLNIRWPDAPLQLEARLLDYKLYAALAYCRANRLNATVIDSPHARFGIVASGKAYGDTRQALTDLGLDETTCRQIGIRLFKCAMVWPLEAKSISEFAEGLTEIMVIEEKRQVIEYQLKEELFQWIGSGKKIPRVIGKFDEKDGGEWAVPQGNWILPAHYEFSPAIVAKAIAARIRKLELPADVRARIDARMAVIEATERDLAVPRVITERTPHFCSGCPHNTSTRVPEGSRAVAGIGCHYMATWMNRSTATCTHMGGEGATWIGHAPFTSERHIFANLGDGTYFHSGSLAIRAAVAAKVAITYKILFNDAVAMTGGQPIDGVLTVPQITRQLAADGVQRIVVVTQDRHKYARSDDFTPGVQIAPREQLDAVQRELREYNGVSALIFDQTCAAELRRRRKRGTVPDPARHAVINELVCEGCGDCSVASNCLSVEPVETEFGRKRRINQSSCNKDFSCLNGFCPSFVTIEGGRLRRPATSQTWPPQVPWPTSVELRADRPYGILVAGIGGTGVVTIGQLVGMAAHIEGRGISVLDVAGLAQKGGAVHSHIQIAALPEQLFATRIAMGDADLLLGCDLIVSSGAEVLAKFRRGRTRALLSSSQSPTAEFVRNREWQFPSAKIVGQIRAAVQKDTDVALIDAQLLATRLLGDSIYANPLLLGAAWQQGWLPLRHESLVRAIELNGAAVEANKRAFEWGRAAVHDLAAVQQAAAATSAHDPADQPTATSLEDIVAVRSKFLVSYQNKMLAQRYERLVEQVAQAERSVLRGSTELAEAVSRNYFKLLAIKDEYEVARLHRDPQFRARIAESYSGNYRVNYYLAPPLLARRDPLTGHPRKMRFGPWLGPVFAGLACLRFLRGTILDPFAHSPERRLERTLLRDYETMIEQILPRLDADKLALAVRMASFPEEIRGFGHVKLQSVERVRPQLEKWRAQWPGLARRAGEPAPAQG